MAEALAFTYGAVGRWLAYLAVVTVVGTAGVTLFVRRAMDGIGADATDGMDRRILGTGIIAALVLICVSAWRLYAQTYSVFGLDDTVSWEHVRVVAFDTAWGRAWMLQLGSAVLAALLLASTVVTRRAHAVVSAAAAVAVVAVVPLTGHAMSHESGRWFIVAVQSLHVLGVGLWIGTLLLVLLLLRPAGDRTFIAAIRAFSPLAVAAVTTIAASGLVTAIIYLDSVSALWAVAYGRTLVLKLILFAGVGALGAYNWQRLLPALEQPGQAHRLTRAAKVELLLAVITLAVTAVLVALPRTHG